MLYLPPATSSQPRGSNSSIRISTEHCHSNNKEGEGKREEQSAEVSCLHLSGCDLDARVANSSVKSATSQERDRARLRSRNPILGLQISFKILKRLPLTMCQAEAQLASKDAGFIIMIMWLRSISVTSAHIRSHLSTLLYQRAFHNYSINAGGSLSWGSLS